MDTRYKSGAISSIWAIGYLLTPFLSVRLRGSVTTRPGVTRILCHKDRLGVVIPGHDSCLRICWTRGRIAPPGNGRRTRGEREAGPGLADGRAIADLRDRSHVATDTAERLDPGGHSWTVRGRSGSSVG